MKEHTRAYAEFAIKHGRTHHNLTEMVDGLTHKQQKIFEDGSVWYEVYDEKLETKEVEEHGIKYEVLVEFFVIEYWSTDDSTRKFEYIKTLNKKKRKR